MTKSLSGAESPPMLPTKIIERYYPNFIQSWENFSHYEGVVCGKNIMK